MPTVNDSSSGQTHHDPRAELLGRFCAINDIRNYLCHPNRIGAYIYATNGWIAIRIPYDGSLEAQDCDKLPSMPGLFEAPVAEFIDMPVMPTAEPCATCSGSGREYKEACDECDGGEFDHGNHSYTCKACDGEGKVNMLVHEGLGAPCEECGGTGHDKGQHISIGTSTYLRILLDKVATLSGVKIQKHSNGNHPARFVFDGGEGVVMPYRV